MSSSPQKSEKTTQRKSEKKIGFAQQSECSDDELKSESEQIEMMADDLKEDEKIERFDKSNDN